MESGFSFKWLLVFVLLNPPSCGPEHALAGRLRKFLHVGTKPRMNRKGAIFSFARHGKTALRKRCFGNLYKCFDAQNVRRLKGGLVLSTAIDHQVHGMPHDDLSSLNSGSGEESLSAPCQGATPEITNSATRASACGSRLRRRKRDLRPWTLGASVGR